MLPLRCGEIAQAVGGTLICGDSDSEVFGVSTDSRKINQGDLFIPITGSKFDGHDFIEEALQKGAVAALTRKDISPREGKTVIKVDDTSKALRLLAAHYRSRFSIPVIGITGSVGKTTTKEFIACVLSQSMNVLKTEGNYNNEIGLPLTMFNLERHHEAAVVEMGMSGFGEIRRLTNIAKPDIAVITNIGVSHIEKLGSRQNILKAKLEILEGLSNNGIVVLNGDDKLLYGLKGLLNFRTVYYGTDEGMDYQAFNIVTAGDKGTYFDITVANRDYHVYLPVPGIHNVLNALAAIAVGVEMGIPMDNIVKGISLFRPANARLNIIELGRIKIINDTYNASPQSMEAAICVLSDIGAKGRKIAVLGDMLEMGDWARQAHLDVGKFAVSKGIDYIITVGNEGRNIARGALEAGAAADCVLSFDKNSEALEFLKESIRDFDIILVKGSRGMKMEEIVDGLLKFFG